MIATHYLYRRIPCGWGRAAFEVRRLAETQPAHVLISGPNTSHCDCVGYYSHGMCRHLAAMLWVHCGWVVDEPPAEFGDDDEPDQIEGEVGQASAGES